MTGTRQPNHSLWEIVDLREGRAEQEWEQAESPKAASGPAWRASQANDGEKSSIH